MLVNLDGFNPDPDEIQPIIRYPRPKNLKQLRLFMGMASWCRKFFNNFATIVGLLTHPTMTKKLYEWEQGHEAAFSAIKAMIASARVLGQPSLDHTLVLQTDASDSGLGEVLTQIIDGVERVISYASRVLTSAERNYSVTERDCLAILWAVGKLRYYVEGYRLEAITDHSSLKLLCNLKNPTGRLARCALD